MKEIKTKTVIKDIKVLNKKANMYRRIKNAYIRIKHQAEQLGYNDESNYVDDAGNSIGKVTGTVAREAGHTVRNYRKKANEKVKGRRSLNEETQQAPTSEVKETVNRSFVQSSAKQQSQHNPFQLAQKSASQTINTSGKVGRTIKKSDEIGGRTIKEVAKGTIKTAQKSIKTAEYKAKATIKTSKLATTNTDKIAKTTQRTVQVIQAAARTAAVSAKTAAKAVMVTIKACIAATKSLIALLVAGGWVAVVVILVICLAGFLLSSVFGVFFSNESSSANTTDMSEVVSQMNGEFAAEIQKIQDDNPHDSLDMPDNNGSIVRNWHDILATYAVKVSADPENGMELAILDDIKIEILLNIFRDMNKINYWVETIEHQVAVTTTDKDGNECKKTVTITETILHINLSSKSYTDMIAEFGFNEQQVKMLNELMQDKYRQLFMQLIGF